MALLLNPPVIFLTGLLLPAGLLLFLVFLCAGALPLLMAGFAGPVRAFSGALLLLNRLGTQTGASFELPAPPFGLLALWYLFFFWFFSESRFMLCRRGKRAARRAVLTVLLAAAVSLALDTFVLRRKPTVQPA